MTDKIINLTKKQQSTYTLIILIDQINDQLRQPPIWVFCFKALIVVLPKF